MKTFQNNKEVIVFLDDFENEMVIENGIETILIKGRLQLSNTKKSKILISKIINQLKEIEKNIKKDN